MSNWYDFIFDPKGPLLDLIFPDLDLSGIYDLTQTSMQAIGDLFFYWISVVLYAPIRFFGVMIDLLNLMIASLTGFVNVIINSGNTIIQLVSDLWTGVLPGPWVSLLLVIILVNIVLRVYYYIKDISILGNKI